MFTFFPRPASLLFTVSSNLYPVFLRHIHTQLPVSLKYIHYLLQVFFLSCPTPCFLCVYSLPTTRFLSRKRLPTTCYLSVYSFHASYFPVFLPSILNLLPDGSIGFQTIHFHSFSLPLWTRPDLISALLYCPPSISYGAPSSGNPPPPPPPPPPVKFASLFSLHFYYVR